MGLRTPDCRSDDYKKQVCWFVMCSRAASRVQRFLHPGLPPGAAREMKRCLASGNFRAIVKNEQVGLFLTIQQDASDGIELSVSAFAGGVRQRPQPETGSLAVVFSKLASALPLLSGCSRLFAQVADAGRRPVFFDKGEAARGRIVRAAGDMNFNPMKRASRCH